MSKSINISMASVLITVVSFALTISYPYAVGSYVLILGISLLVFFSFWLEKRNGYRLTHNNNLSYLFLGLPFLFFFIWMLLSLAINRINYNSVIRVIQFAGCISAFYLASNYTFSNSQFSLARLLIKGTMVICLIKWILDGLPLYNYSFIFGNPNSFSSILLCWFIVISLNLKKDISDFAFLFIIVFFMVITTARAAIVSILIYVTLSFLFERYEKKKQMINRRVFDYIFLVEVLVILLFIIVYSGFILSNVGDKLQQLSLEYFHKNFYSGRQLVWSELIPLILAKPILGYGLSVVPSDLLANIHYSGHNTYLQVSLQMGLIATLALLLIIRNIIQVTATNYSNHLRLNTIAFSYSVIFHECFEVCLTQNMLACGLIMWFMFGLGCNPFLRANR